jgi:enoyl-CoA hydratase/carnithine racemase
MTVRVERDERIAVVTLDRPKQLNALSTQLMNELVGALGELDVDPEVRCIVLAGSERVFAAGADIEEMADATAMEMLAQRRVGQWDAIRTLRTPLVAAVSGWCLGGGCELAMACHVRVASDNAKFGQPEVKLGIAPGYGGTQRLPRLVGKGVALQLILTGEMIDAHEAHRIGLVTKVVPAGELLAEAERLLRGILAMGPLAVRLALEAVDQGLEMSLEEGLLLEANHFGLLAATRDMKEGLTAFLEKRQPRFEGR